MPLTRRGLLRATGAAAVPLVALPAHATETAVRGGGARGCAAGADVAGILAHDMVGRHQGRMHGVPSDYNWARGPVLRAGNHPRGCTAIDAWGQIYESASGSPAVNVRVEARDIAVWVRSTRTGRWRLAAGSRGVFGYNYVEDFHDDDHKDAGLRSEPDGGVSATLGDGYNFHFSPATVRGRIDPDDVGGVVSLYTARVIVDDPSGPDQRDQARYLASAGADYWQSRDAAYDGGGSNPPVATGKARWLGTDWMTVTMSTLDERKLAADPPPICLRGR